MSAARLSIPAGLLVGIVVAALVLGGIVLLAPEPVPTAPAASAAAPPSPSPSLPVPSSVAPSASPSGSVGPGSSPATGAFRIGGPADAVVPQVGGGMIDLASLRRVPVGGIGPDIMAVGLRSIMPGVDVQP